jgi:hypothetical protein
MGAFSLRASSTTSAWAPAHPAPQNSVTREAPLRTFASFSISTAPGRKTGAVGTIHSGTSASIFMSATSPGNTTTATPRLATATRMARLSICGSCPGFETSST